MESIVQLYSDKPGEILNFLNKTWKSFKNVLTKLIVHIIIAIVVNRQPVQNSICRCGGTC